MNQTFEIKELKRLCSQTDYIKYDMSISELDAILENDCKSIYDESFEFEITKKQSFLLTENLSHKLILRKLNDNIKRIYKDEQSNRKIIISQIKVLLGETCPSWIIKTDIKSFYESIDRSRLLAKFRDDSMLSYFSMLLLNKLFSNPIIIHSNGLPRGINISSTMSEIYMRKFDKWVRNYSGVYFYARFVDDIIIFSHKKDDALSLIKDLSQSLSDLAGGLTKNDAKTQLFDGLTLKQLDTNDGSAIVSEEFIDYLGYKFFKSHTTKSPQKCSNCKIDLTKPKKETRLYVSIADKKVKKIKSRITLSLIEYIKDGDFNILLNRIQFLTGNYSIKKSSEGTELRAGIYFNYSQISDLSKLDELNTYYRKLLFCKNGSLGRKLRGRLTTMQISQLKKFCFKAGFNNKTYTAFKFEEMDKIVSCW